MGIGLARTALWALVAVMMVTSVIVIPGARASPTTNYTLQGYVDQPGGIPVPAGVTVELISAGTHQVYKTTTTANSGGFSFTNFPSGGNTANALGPGWWGVWVPPQANLKLTGCSPCAILPGSQNPTYYNENASNLTSATYQVGVSGVTRLAYDSEFLGNATWGSTGKAVSGASVQLLDPLFGGFVLANNTTSTTGYYTLAVPSGSWVLQTTASGSPNQFSFNNTTVATQTKTVNPVINKYFAYGTLRLASAPSKDPNGGNISVYDPVNHYVYTQPIAGGGFYDVGTYPAGFTTGSANTFDVIASTVGYSTAWYPITVSSGSPSGTGNPHDLLVSPIAPPAQYNTTIDFSKGFGFATISTHALLSNGSVFPDLPNASVGQLWAQLGLDSQNSLSFSAATGLPWINRWVGSSGPFFPVGQNQLTVAYGANTTLFNQTTNYTWTNASNCVGSCGLSSSAWLQYNYSQTVLSAAAVAKNQSTYQLSFQFRHPTHSQSINYTIVLPKGYVLTANNPAPPQSRLVAAGPGKTWTSFTLVSNQSSAAYSTASLTAVKYANVSAIVNVTASNFAFSTKNVLNQSRGNYTFVAAQGENLTFSALNSSFPAGTNGTSYKWVFGDSSTKTVTTPTTWHTYAAFGPFNGSLNVTSSGGQSSSTTFRGYIGSTPPKAVISVNQTVQTVSNGGQYILVNWSTAVHFNASLSTSSVYPSAPVKGIISVASWTVVSTKYTPPAANYTGKTSSNYTLPLLGAGLYLTNGTVNGSAVPFKGWQYNVTLTVWDGGGHSAKATLVVLVRDTQKPTVLAGVLNSAGKDVASPGITEGANHKALVYLWANGSSDPNNGSIVQYDWNITNPGNSSIHNWTNQSSAGPAYRLPAKAPLWLDPQTKPYSINLTAWDRAGNKAWTVTTLTVAINASQRPVLTVGNLTAPSTMTDGSSYNVWANVTNTIGKNSTALAVSVSFYLLDPSGSGSRIGIGGSPGSVVFYNYTNASGLSTTAAGHGTVSLKYNQTVRAEVSFTPGRSGTFDLWVNATAQNEFAGDYASGANQAHVQVSLNPSNTTLYIEYGAIVAVVAIILVLAFLYLTGRLGGKRLTKGSTKSSGGSKKESTKDEDDDEEDDE
ncbi:MAG: PKD domain-containing protein [Thermoplasmata archaeon]|nr:PKD domain-containing protein [Thermoplasmata archaeon]